MRRAEGGSIKWDSPVKIRHVASGRYLSVDTRERIPHFKRTSTLLNSKTGKPRRGGGGGGGGGGRDGRDGRDGGDGGGEHDGHDVGDEDLSEIWFDLRLVDGLGESHVKEQHEPGPLRWVR